MDEERFALRLDHFRMAIDALDLALLQPEDEFMRDSIIKRFELCFETARKMMRQWLVEQDELTGTATKREVMQAAFATGLLTDAELWEEIARWRNDASHEYDKQKAMQVVAFVRTRAADAFHQLRVVVESR